MSTNSENVVDEYTKAIKKVARAIVSAGILPFPITETLIEILKFYLDKDDAKFIAKAFKSKKSMNMEQLLKKTKMEEAKIIEMMEKLAKKGFVFNQPNRAGVMVYRLLPLVVVGTFEYTFMQKLQEDLIDTEYKRLAKLYETLMEELRDRIQEGYDNLLPIFEKQPPVDRTIPLYNTTDGKKITIEINKEIEAEEKVLPAQTVEEIINKFDDIAVGNCFCRQYREVLGHKCEFNAPMETCFTFGKSARHVVSQGFARMIEKDEALKILKEAEDAGLVHKAFHDGSDIYRTENSICNCCKDCCDTFQLWRMGATPMVNSTNFLSKINENLCIACGTCIERCPVDAISFNENEKAQSNPEYCIGCGVCAHFCPENAITLIEGMRKVFVPPPRMRK